MAVTPIDLDTWMRQSNSSNVLSNLARVNALTASVMGELVNLQKLVVEEVAAKIKQIGDLNVRIKKFANATDSKPDAGVTVGTSAADALDLLTQLKAVGVSNLDSYITAVKTAGTALSTNNQFISNVSLELQTLGESQQNISQQESLRLQTMTNRYTQANDQASTVIQKDGQSKGTVTSNLRGSGG